MYLECSIIICIFYNIWTFGPSSVEISLERGSKRSAEPIDLKIGLNMDD